MNEEQRAAALRLADRMLDFPGLYGSVGKAAATELRRLHAEVEGHRVIREELSRQVDALRAENANLTRLLEATQDALDRERAENTALREAVTKFDAGEQNNAAPKQDANPVAWIRRDQLRQAMRGNFMCVVGPTKTAIDNVPLYLHPPQDTVLREAAQALLALWDSDGVFDVDALRAALEAWK